MAWNGKGYVPPPSFQQQQPQIQNWKKQQGQQQHQFAKQPPNGFASPSAHQPQQQSIPAQGQAARPRMSSGKWSKNWIAGILIGALAVVVVFAVLIGSNGGSDEKSGDSSSSGGNGDGTSSGGGGTSSGGGGSTQEQKLFPAEIRSGNDYVGLFLLNEMPDEAFTAFKSAASRWSKIVGNTGLDGGTVPAGDGFCGVTIDQAIPLDHLAIFAKVAPIDGVNGILGQSSPCALTNHPILGTMDFDSADIASLITEGAVESVILHEMGHVLGIGTLWSGNNLLQDAVFQGDQVLANNHPKMTGANAIREYSKLTGNNEKFVPVEDGTDASGRDLFSPKSTGRGSIDGHWDEDFFPGELMEFRINTRNRSPPMSATTIASLADLGYTVDLSQADAYSLSAARAERLRGSGSGTEFWMINDISDIPVIQLPVEN